MTGGKTKRAGWQVGLTEGRTGWQEKRRKEGIDDRRTDGKKDSMTGQRTKAEDGRKEGQDYRRTDGKKDRMTGGLTERRTKRDDVRFKEGENDRRKTKEDILI
jgi:hypothetical protein